MRILRTSLAGLVAAFLLHAGEANAFSIFHSPADDGINPGVADIPADGSEVTLHLWFDPGELIYGYSAVKLEASEGLSIERFVDLNPAQGLLFNFQAPSALALDGGDIALGDAVPARIGDLVVRGTRLDVALWVVGGSFTNANFVADMISPHVIAGIAGVSDPTPEPFVDPTPDPVPDPAPMPAPEPIAEPSPEPTPEPEPIPEPGPAPDPTRDPERILEPYRYITFEPAPEGDGELIAINDYFHYRTSDGDVLTTVYYATAGGNRAFVTPEPSTIRLVLAGLVAAALMRMMRRRACDTP